METALLVALIAAMVSMASVIANIYIARKSRQSAIELLRIQANLETLEDLRKNIKTVEVEGERLRIRAHDLLAFLTRKGDGTPGLGSQEEFSKLAQRFANQANEFMDSWADAKSDLPEEMLDQLRILRHDCASPIRDILFYCKTWSHNPPHSTQEARPVVSALERLLALLDAFTRHLSDVRRRELKSAAKGN